ncbi:helix-turn-helix domain-containing protein, partial [Pseudomonas aeruginosa]|nr:helix-turn-helix domain-containing protein [Pseudomonas aeruginosa]
ELLVSVATVYRWLDRVERAGSVSCLLRKRRSDAGVRRLDARVEQVIKEVILSDYLTELKKSPVIPPFLALARNRGQAARANFCLGVMPPRAIFGLS